MTLITDDDDNLTPDEPEAAKRTPEDDRGIDIWDLIRIWCGAEEYQAAHGLPLFGEGES